MYEHMIGTKFSSIEKLTMRSTEAFASCHRFTHGSHILTTLIFCVFLYDLELQNNFLVRSFARPRRLGVHELARASIADGQARLVEAL